MNTKHKKQPEATPETVYFIFYKSYQEAIDKISDPATQLQVYKAIANYALFGIEPELTGVGDLVWGLILPMLEKSLKRQRIGRATGGKGAKFGQRGAEYGKKGGRPRTNPQQPTSPEPYPDNVKTVVNFGRRHSISREVCESFFNGNNDEGKRPEDWRKALKEFAEAAEGSRTAPGVELDPNEPPKPTPQETPPQQNHTQAAEVVEVEAVEVVEVKETPQEARKPKRPRFIPPTVEEVAAYCRERGNNIDANEFIDHYTANGWVQGKGKPIKDWRACVRTWERHTEYRNRPQTRQQNRENLMRGAATRLAGAIEREQTEEKRFKCTLGDFPSPATANDTKPF